MNFIPKKGRQDKELLILSKKIEKLQERVEKDKLLNNQKYRALQDFVRLLTNFASHDIKNAVHNMDGVLVNMESSEITKSEVQILKQCVESIRSSLEEFKVLSSDRDKDKFELLELITALSSLHRPLFKKEKVLFKVAYNEVDKKMIVNQAFHPTLQIFNNLLINAYEFLDESEERNILVDINLDKKGGMLIFKICDTGIGISKTNRKKIFKPYFTTKKGGSGVGLAHVKFAIEDMGGVVELTDAANTNFSTIFTLKIPLD